MLLIRVMPKTISTAARISTRNRSRMLASLIQRIIVDAVPTESFANLDKVSETVVQLSRSIKNRRDPANRCTSARSAAWNIEIGPARRALRERSSRGVDEAIVCKFDRDTIDAIWVR